MNKLRQKCFVASAGLHLLLVVILVIGPAFLTSKSKVDDSPVLDVIPGTVIDAAFSGGGNPHGTPPPPAPIVPRPPAPVQPAPEPEPVKAPGAGERGGHGTPTPPRRHNAEKQHAHAP